VRGREATLQKDRETIQLALPAPSDLSGNLLAPGGNFGLPLLPGEKEPQL